VETQLRTSRAALAMLDERLAVVQRYVDAVIAGTVPPDRCVV